MFVYHDRVIFYSYEQLGQTRLNFQASYRPPIKWSGNTRPLKGRRNVYLIVLMLLVENKCDIFDMVFRCADRLVSFLSAKLQASSTRAVSYFMSFVLLVYLFIVCCTMSLSVTPTDDLCANFFTYLQVALT